MSNGVVIMPRVTIGTIAVLRLENTNGEKMDQDSLHIRVFVGALEGVSSFQGIQLYQRHPKINQDPIFDSDS
jgi:hypothetical protein